MARRDLGGGFHEEVSGKSVLPLSRKYNTSFTAGGVISALIIGLLVAATIGTWLTMLGLGVLHSRIPAIPALGFGDSFFVSIGLWLIGLKGAIFGTSSSKVGA